MAVTNLLSTQLTNAAAGKKLQTPGDVANLYLMFFDFVQVAAGDASSTMAFIDLPAGRWHFIGDLSAIEWDAFGAARTLEMGWNAYIDGADNTSTVSANDAGLDDAIDVSSAGHQIGLGRALAAGTGRRKLFNVGVGGCRILATVDVSTIPDGTKINGHLAFAKA